VVDLTPPEIGELGLRAVKVLVPGAYPMNFDSRWPHFGGGRLRQVPVGVGLRDDPLPISQLNRVPHPFP
jgi:ribosomal protein S12 methylthiotransferase accessory factor